MRIVQAASRWYSARRSDRCRDFSAGRRLLRRVRRLCTSGNDETPAPIRPRSPRTSNLARATSLPARRIRCKLRVTSYPTKINSSPMHWDRIFQSRLSYRGLGNSSPTHWDRIFHSRISYRRLGNSSPTRWDRIFPSRISYRSLGNSSPTRWDRIFSRLISCKCDKSSSNKHENSSRTHAALIISARL